MRTGVLFRREFQPSRGVSCATCTLKDTEDLYICRWCTARNEKQFLAFHGKCPDSKADPAPFELTSEVLCTKCSTSVIFATFKKSSFFGSIPRFLKKANAPPVVATVTPEDEGLWVHNYVRGALAAPPLDFCEQFHLLHDLKEFFQNRKDSLSDVCKSCKRTTDVPTSSCHTCGLSIHQACWCPGFSDEDTLTQDTRIICTLCTKQILLGATSLAAPARRPQPYTPRTLSLFGRLTRVQQYKWIRFSYEEGRERILLRLHEGNQYRELLPFLDLFRMFINVRSFVHLSSSCPRCEKELNDK